MQFFRVNLFLILFTLCFTGVNAQGTIQDQFNTFYEEETNSWQEYRMMKRPKLKDFWAMTSDTLRLKDQQIATGKKEIKSLKEELDSKKTTIAELESQLAESQQLNDSMSFLGFEMSKTGYAIMVWSIVFVLAAAVVAIYFMFLRSNHVTKKVQKAYSSLESEYAEHRDKARESQVKLKRELQTALNALHENRINL